VATQMLCVFIGGTETVPKVVAHGLWELLRHPDQLAAVRADPAVNVPVAREEMIRYCAPAQWFARTARKPFTIHDTTIEPGQRIITLLASANRDEREYLSCRRPGAVAVSGRRGVRQRHAGFPRRPRQTTRRRRA
jgi:cytochrome P450